MRLNKILIIFLVIGIISSSFIVYKRNSLESYYKNYEVDFYYDELEKIAEQEEKSIDEILLDFKETGIQNMLIREDTIQSMKRSSKYDVETKLDGYDMIVTSSDEKLIEKIYQSYLFVKKEDRNVVKEDKNTVRIEGKSYEQITAPVLTLGNYGQRNITTQVWEGSVLETVGLGYDDEAIEKAKKYGYGVVLAPVFNPDFQDANKSIDNFFAILDKNQIEQTHIFFSGNFVLGYDPIFMKNANDDEKKPIEKLASGLEDRNIALGFIESSSQGGYLETEGLKQLAKLMEYEATGTYLTWDFVQTKYDFGIPAHHNGEEITNIFFRGITTRNIRLITLKPFILDNRYIADSNAYKNVLDNLSSRLAVHNIKQGKLQTLEYFETNKLFKIMSAMGILAAAFIILDNLIKINRRLVYMLFSIFSFKIVIVYTFLDSLQNISDKLYALLGAIVGPILATFILISFIKDKYRLKNKDKYVKSYMNSVFRMICLIGICFISVIFEVTMLAGNKYFLGLDSFSGVKVSQMIPILMVAVVYISYYGYKRGYKSNELGIKTDDVQRFLRDDIKIWQVLLIGITGIVLIIFMVRSGNTSGTPSVFEALLRNILEGIFPARPRTKAIFIGIPALILLLYNAHRNQYEKFIFPLSFVGSISFVNVVNTFSHMKAPIYLSMYRTGAEIIVGSFVALVIIFLQEIVDKKLIKYKKV